MEIEDNEQEILLEQENVSVGGGAVNSVNGQVGDVVLTTSDLENTSDYQTGSEVESAISTAVGAEATAREQADMALQTAITDEATTRANADTNLQSQIDAISASSDVTDIVGTYAQLQAYDTSTLGNNDIIKVLQDESRNNETTYYRWSTATQSFTLIGEEGPYYTKSQTDTLLADKQNTLTAGDGLSISNDEINGVDFVGTDGTTAGEAGLVPAPATTDAGKFLKADGTWDDAGGSGPTVVQTTGTSTTDVMSQSAVTSMVFADPATQLKVQVGGGVAGNVQYGTAIGSSAQATGEHSIAIGGGRNDYESARAQASGSIAIGAGSFSKTQGVISVAANSYTQYGYNNTKYRLLSGVHDPVDDHDAANKTYVDTAVAGAGGGGVKELTADDYNAPASNPTAVALALLEPGVYVWKNDVNVRVGEGSSDLAYSRGRSAIVGYGNTPSSSSLRKIVFIFGGASNSNSADVPMTIYTMAENLWSPETHKSILTDFSIVNVLTSTSTSRPLSANQGKVLNDKITALEARVAALEGN